MTNAMRFFLMTILAYVTLCSLGPAQEPVISSAHAIELTDVRDSSPSTDSDILSVEPYWVTQFRTQVADSQAALRVQLDEIIALALVNSNIVKIIQIEPEVKQAQIRAAEGVFDPKTFVDSMLSDTSDPVGNTLTTGGPPRLVERKVDNQIGLKGTNPYGGTTSLSQSALLKDNNSVFLSPKQQGDTRLLLRLDQPLMRGGGKQIATSSIQLAKVDWRVSNSEAAQKLQEHIFQINEAYWNLFAAQAIELQSQRACERLIFLKNQLSARQTLDSLASQVQRAEAGIAKQTANAARAKADAMAAQLALRTLANALDISHEIQVKPATLPVDNAALPLASEQLAKALMFNPALRAASDKIAAARVRLRVAENELRPTLDLVVESYLHGLNRDYDLGQSVVDQFSQGRPSYSGGFSYQRPYRNRVANAIVRERRLDLRQLLLNLDQTMLSVSSETSRMIASIQACQIELESAVKAALAIDSEIRLLNQKLENAFVSSSEPSTILDQLLTAHLQLAQAENSWAQSQARHMIEWAKLQQVTGCISPWHQP